MNEIINLTPHAIHVRPDANLDLEVIYEPYGSVVRLAVEYRETGKIDRVPVVAAMYGEPEGLPAPKAGRTLIVSGFVRQALKGRPDVVAPDTGPTAIRDNGQVVAVTRFVGAPW